MNKQYHFVVIAALLFLSTACSTTLRSTKVINSFYKNPDAAKKFGIQPNETQQQQDTIAMQEYERIWNSTHDDVLAGLESVSHKEQVEDNGGITLGNENITK